MNLEPGVCWACLCNGRSDVTLCFRFTVHALLEPWTVGKQGAQHGERATTRSFSRRSAGHQRLESRGSWRLSFGRSDADRAVTIQGHRSPPLPLLRL